MDLDAVKNVTTTTTHLSCRNTVDYLWINREVVYMKQDKLKIPHDLYQQTRSAFLPWEWMNILRKPVTWLDSGAKHPILPTSGCFARGNFRPRESRRSWRDPQEHWPCSNVMRRQCCGQVISLHVDPANLLHQLRNRTDGCSFSVKYWDYKNILLRRSFKIPRGCPVLLESDV